MAPPRTKVRVPKKRRKVKIPAQPRGRPRLNVEEVLQGVELSESSPKKSLRNPRAQRQAWELTNAVTLAGLTLDAVSKRALQIHSVLRGVYMTTLISDIINTWLARATDYKQEIFRKGLPKSQRCIDVPERWLGYLKSIGATPEDFEFTAIPAEGYPDVGPELTEEKWGDNGMLAEPKPRRRRPDPDPEFVGEPAEELPPEDPLAPKPVVPPVEVDPVPIDERMAAYGGTGVRRFDAEEHNRVAPAIGRANSAQAFDLGEKPKPGAYDFGMPVIEEKQ